MSQWKWASEK